MTKGRFIFSFDYDHGEADLSKSAKLLIDEIIETDPLLAADLLKDVAGISQGLYTEALDAMRADWEKRRAKAEQAGVGV